MNGLIKRVKAFALGSLFLACLNFSACICNGKTLIITDNFKVYDGFSVNFLDVGEGDAIFICFDDGKTMLIDCGEKSDGNLKTVERYLDAYAKDGLDYFILTHPDTDHVGNAAAILEDYMVNAAYIPDLNEPENFSAYYNAYVIIKERGIDKISATGNVISGEDYYAVFLSPNAKGTTDSAYGKVNLSETPSATDINDLSPIIYLDYKGVRFVFTGDAGLTQETVALQNVKTGIIRQYLKNKGKKDVNLTDIDFLKVAHHGAYDGSGEAFLGVLTPTNAIISVGGDNRYGHPSEKALSRIYAANGNCKVYTTSEYGTVSVLVDKNGQITVKTDALIA